MSGGIKNRTVYMLCRTDGGNDVYVGSTSCPLGKRFAEHKHNAGNPSTYYGGSKLYQKMREVGVHSWEIVPLLTFACNQETICGFEQEWIKALNANLNIISSVDEDLVRRVINSKYFKRNKEMRRYYCELCGIACKDKYNLNRHFDTYKHFMNCVCDID